MYIINIYVCRNIYVSSLYYFNIHVVCVAGLIGILYGIFMVSLGWKSHIPITAIALNVNGTSGTNSVFSQVFVKYSLEQPIPASLGSGEKSCNENGCKVRFDEKLTMVNNFLLPLIFF
jgi:hypothetical protein